MNTWAVSVSVDQSMVPCLPGKELVPWVVPVTHSARTAHPRLRGLGKHRLTELVSVQLSVNNGWGTMMCIRRGFASRKGV